MRDLRINRIFEGSSEIMRLLIAREAVDAHLTAAGDLANPKADLRQKAAAAAGASRFYAKWLPKLVFGEGQLPTTYREFGALATHLRFVERSSRKLARNTFYGMARWQASLEKKQGFLGRIVDIGAELFAISAACVRAEAQRTADPVEGEQAYELAEAFCQQATLRVEALFDALWSNTDSIDVRLANDVLEGRYTWLEQGYSISRRHRTVDRVLGTGSIHRGQSGSAVLDGVAIERSETLGRPRGRSRPRGPPESRRVPRWRVSRLGAGSIPCRRQTAPSMR